MTPDQISKLPPELQIWAKMLNRLHDEGSLNVDQERLYAALTWGLQVVEERDAAQKRTIEEALVFYQDGIAECRLGDLIIYNSITGDDGDNEVVENFCRELNKRVAKCVPPVERELENFRKYEESLNSWSRKLETAEATIATLTRLCELQDQLLICYRLQTRPTEGLLTGIRKAKAALSHTPEGKTL